ncbi:enoyl-CoA hydratase [Photobacterium sanctipauli]|uniref:Enoyl-CoA hydratase n=1 Tax=Photobacterium sanctipauli TaxID=1342794 RepID=A0A2T3NY04_9GAMM|nr:enoyl-CoA hydratase-related protein [Photobacterium sanctipauli]PSW21183.1 enoyl-CoA hydratase [Photobacterium sanctipauli]
MNKAIQHHHERHVLYVKINRPEAKNALNQTMYEKLAIAIEQADSAKEVRAIVLTGLPGIFCGGNDIKDFVAMAEGMADFAGGRFMKALINCDTPLVAAIDGPAIGIGTTMLQFFDFIYCSPKALFKTPFVPLGLCPEMASSVQLAKIIGHRKAKSMLLLGEAMDAPEALKLGFINAISDDPEQAATKCANTISQLPPKAMRVTKSMLTSPERDKLLKLIKRENEQLMHQIRQPEAKKAFNAFLEKDN